MESGKHKKRINYTVMIVSDSPDGGIHPFYLGQMLVSVILGLIAAVLIISIGIAVHHSAALGKAKEKETELQKQVEELTAANQELTSANSELSDKVTLLSDTVAQNEQMKEAEEREKEEKKIPNGFPLAGPAVILESSETQTEAADADEDEGDEENAEDEELQSASNEPIVVFSASVGTRVIATASGTIASVEEDAVYGHRVTIDHENGYTSIYRAASEPRVSEGDTVEIGSTLYEMQSPEEKLGYQITRDGILIDPLELLEVYG